MRLTRMVLAVSCAISVGFVGSPALGEAPSHCAFRLVPIGRADQGRVITARLKALGCHATFAQALAAGSEGRIAPPADITPATLTQARLDAYTTDRFGQPLIGTEFDGINYAGGSKSYFAANTCQGQTWEVPFVGDEWNNRFTSGKGFGGCDNNKKFAAGQFGGDVLTCTPSCSHYGNLADAVSSLRWRP